VPKTRIDLADAAQAEAAKQKQIKARARWFLELALDNALAAYDGDGRAVEAIALGMLDQMKG
jgi:hypothetical protein